MRQLNPQAADLETICGKCLQPQKRYAQRPWRTTWAEYPSGEPIQRLRWVMEPGGEVGEASCAGVGAGGGDAAGADRGRRDIGLLRSESERGGRDRPRTAQDDADRAVSASPFAFTA